MKCPQCNTELPDSAIFCVQCGSTIRAASFSYLPTGAPAWPTEVLKSTQYRNVLPESAQYIGPGETSSNVSSSSVSPKKRLGIPAIIGLCILSILIGGGLTFGILYLNGQRLAVGPQPALKPLKLPAQSATSTPAASLTPTAQGNQLPTPTAFQSVTSKDLGMSLQFPSDWVQDPTQTTASGNTSVNFHPQQNLPVSMFIAKLSPSVSAQVTDTNEVNQANLQGFGSNNNLQNFKVLTNTPLHRLIGGINWDEQDATYTTSSGLLIHAVSISVKHNTLYYNILYFAPDSVYDEAFQKYYSQMLNSIKFS